MNEYCRPIYQHRYNTVKTVKSRTPLPPKIILILTGADWGSAPNSALEEHTSLPQTLDLTGAFF